MIDEYLFENNVPIGVKSIYCNVRTYSRDQFMIERQKFLQKKRKNLNYES